MGLKMKKHQHTAPVSYLRGFVDEGSTLSIRRRTGERREVGVRDVAVRRNFYRFTDEAGAASDVVEEWFADEVESPAAPVLARLRAGEQVGERDQTALSWFVAAQVLRTATARSYMAQIDGYVGPWLLATDVLRRRGVRFDLLDPRAQQAHLSAAAARLAASADDDRKRASQLRTMVREIARLQGRMSSWSWQVLVADRPRLITGDAPAVSFEPTRHGFSGVVADGSPVFVPLSPTRLLVGSKGPRREGETVSSALALRVNRRVADQADDCVVKAPWQGWPRKLRFGARPPRLRAPSFSASVGGGVPTFPARYPEIETPSVRVVLERLGAVDIVE